MGRSAGGPAPLPWATLLVVLALLRRAAAESPLTPARGVGFAGREDAPSPVLLAPRSARRRMR